VEEWNGARAEESRSARGLECRGAGKSANWAQVQQCASAGVQERNGVRVQGWSNATVLEWNSVRVQESNSVRVQGWSNAAVLEWNSVRVQERNSATAQECRSAGVLESGVLECRGGGGLLLNTTRLCLAVSSLTPLLSILFFESISGLALENYC
jgi:hypothetical protein